MGLTPRPDYPASGPRAKAGAQDSPPPRPARRFHVGDLLSVTMYTINVSRRGQVGTEAVLRYMADDWVHPYDELARYAEDFRAAMLAVYPEFDAYSCDIPEEELREIWLRRREREFGRYLPAPKLPRSHPLRARPLEPPSS